MPAPEVVFSPDSHVRLRRGFDVLAGLLARTIGPADRQILSAAGSSTGPELLTDAATIARRFLALPDRREDVGAMLARNLVWRIHQTTGDGCATAVALAQAMIAEAYRCVEASADAASLRRGIAAATDVALDTLERMSRPVCGERDLLQVAQTATGESRISALLAEIYDILGSDGYVTVEEYLAPYLERQYLPGGQWKAHLASPYLISSPEQQCAVLQNVTVALFAGELVDLDDIRPLLDILAETDRRRLLLVANKIEGDALSAVVLNHQRKQIQIVAATLYRAGEANRQDFADLAVLTGARALAPETGDRLKSISAADMGTAQYVKATADRLIVSGRGDRPALREHIAALRQQLARVVVDREGERDEIRARIGRMSGNVATLKIGAPTRSEAAILQQKAEQGIRALSSALRDGVVLGGGVAYLNCIPALRQLRLAGDEAVGAAIVARALEAPFCWIVANASARKPALILAEARRQGPHYGYDAVADSVVDLEQAGIADSAGVVSAALRAAASAATLLMTTDVVVLKRDPALSIEP